jgi:hypothetical protein
MTALARASYSRGSTLPDSLLLDVDADDAELEEDREDMVVEMLGALGGSSGGRSP